MIPGMFSDLHKRALAEFRGYTEKERTPDARPVSFFLADVLQKLGLKEKLQEEEVLAAWKDIVGEFLAAHSAPSGLKRGVLLVQVLQSTVHYELDRVWKGRILEGFQARFGADTVREIRFRV